MAKPWACQQQRGVFIARQVFYGRNELNYIMYGPYLFKKESFCPNPKTIPLEQVGASHTREATF